MSIPALSIEKLSQFSINLLSSSSLYGLKKCTYLSENSPKLPALDENTLQWYDNASSIGKPNPSYFEGNIKAAQLRYR